MTLATACSLRRVLSNESIDFIENKAAISESKNKMINGFSESGFLLMEEP